MVIVLFYRKQTPKCSPGHKTTFLPYNEKTILGIIGNQNNLKPNDFLKCLYTYILSKSHLMQEQNISSLYKIFLLRIPFRDESYNYCLYVHLLVFSGPVQLIPFRLRSFFHHIRSNQGIQFYQPESNRRSCSRHRREASYNLSLLLLTKVP